jgi:hypothetical protein
MDEYEEAVLFTFSELESRLERLEYILGGPKAPTTEKPQTIPDRIHNIEKSLQALGAQTTLLNDARELRMFLLSLNGSSSLFLPVNKHKDVLKPQDEVTTKGPPLDNAQKTVMVVERATSFATVASQLKALDDQKIPGTNGFTKLAVLRPRMSEFEERQLQQAMKISELRRRSMMILQYYKQIHLLGVGRVWMDYSKTLTKALRAVTREEFRRRPDEEGAEEEPDEDEAEEDEDEDDESDDEEL